MSTPTEGRTGRRPGTVWARLVLLAAMTALVGCVTVNPPIDAPRTSPAPSDMPEATPTATARLTPEATPSAAPTAAVTASPTPPMPTFADLKAAASRASYEELLANSLDHISELLYYKGIVILVQRDFRRVMVEVNDGGDAIDIRYTGEEIVVEGEWIEFVGRYSGVAGAFSLPSFLTVTSNVIVAAATTGFDGPSVACGDDARKAPGQAWAKPYRWFFHESSTPAGYDVDETLAVLQRSIANITDARNDCGLPDNVDATHEYLGTTNAKPGINELGSKCAKSDGKNVVGFGPLPADILGVTCTVSVGRTMTEADIVFSSTENWALDADSCFQQELLEPLATHEFGHAFGLEHVDQEEHAALTMSPVTDGLCRNDESTLGLGDVLGLEKLY